VRRLTGVAAALCGLALLAFPLTLFPDAIWTRWLSGLALVAIAGAIALRSQILVGAAGALVVSLYVLSLGASRAQPLVAVAGVGILLLLELLELATATDGVMERPLVRRRAWWIMLTTFVAAVVALIAQAAGQLLNASHPLLFIVAVACAGLALALISSLAFHVAEGSSPSQP
jgi:hypothetical protein